MGSNRYCWELGGGVRAPNCDPPPRAFCSTVRGFPTSRGHHLTDPCPPPAPQCQSQYQRLPQCGGPDQGRVKTSMKWDFYAGHRVPFKKVDYGEELYALAAENVAKQLALEKRASAAVKGQNKNGGRGSKSKSTSTSAIPTVDALMGEDTCRDFARPGFHSSLKAGGDLAKALDDLNRLPGQMARIIMNDDRFEPIVFDKATKVLNVPRKEKVFKDLISVEPNTEAEERLTKSISEQIKAVRPVNRSRDPEPNLLDYQESSFSRIRPTAVPPPATRPQAGVGLNMRTQTQYQMMDAEKQFEDAADKI